MDAKQATRLAKACVLCALSHSIETKTVFHEVHTELRVASSTVQLMFALKVETALPLMERFGLHSYCRSVDRDRFKMPVSLGTRLPFLSVNRGYKWEST